MKTPLETKRARQLDALEVHRGTTNFSESECPICHAMPGWRHKYVDAELKALGYRPGEGSR